MVVKIKRKSCIVLTAEGEYREVPLPAGDVPRLGQAIKLEGRKKLPYLKQLMAVASLFIVLMAGMLYLGKTPPAAAYLTIDINPSIELAVSTAGKVISARAMDSEGEKILAMMVLSRSKRTMRSRNWRINRNMESGRGPEVPARR
jgi:hypothetical protein